MCAYKAPSFDTLSALETAPSLFLVLSPDLIILTASDLLMEATKTERSRIVGRYIFDAFPDNPDAPYPGGSNSILSSLQEVIRTKKPHAMKVIRYDVPDNDNPGNFIPRYWQPQHTPVFDDAGEISYIIQLGSNVTDQIMMSKQLAESKDIQLESILELQALHSELDIAHRQLKEFNVDLEQQVIDRTLELKYSEEKYRNLIQYSPIAMQVFKGPDMTFEIVNESMLKFLGKTSDIIGKTLFEGVPEIVGQPIVDVLFGIYHTGNSLELHAEEVSLERDGQIERGYYDVIYRPIYEGNDITGVLGIAIDVTPQITAQNAIQESELRFRSMAEGSGILISTIGIDKEIDYLNATWLQYLGMSLDQIKLIGWQNNIHPEDLEQITIDYNKAMHRHHPFELEFRLLNAEKKYRWLRLKGAPRFDANQAFKGYICSGVDFTEEKQQLLEIAHINIALVQANNQLEHANEQLRHSEENLQFAFNAGDLGSCTLNLLTGQAEISTRYRALFGLPLTGEITWEMVTAAVEPEFLEEVNLAMVNAARYGMPVDSTYAIRHLETGERRWMRVTGKVRVNDQGMYSHIYAIVMDVTTQKQDEQRKNDFIAMVSHELKTPLTSVTGYTQVLKRLATKEEDTRSTSLLSKMEHQVKKMSTMINGFLNISRLESGKIQMDLQKFDMDLLIKEIADEFDTMSGQHIEYHANGQLMIVADRDKIGHVINNLMSNAIKYSGVGSRIIVKCTVVNNEQVFSITDEGVGVNQEDLPKLFDRYYRVQAAQASNVSGFGIGLYLSAEIIERHGGKIWAESEVGIGSTFYFSLPLSA